MNNCEKNPLVSVIVPVYNVEKYLKRCLDSIVNQTYKNIEVICIDDGSPDRSIDILREFESNDNRIKIIRQKNMGLSSARNTGINMAKGEYIIFVDSDDDLELNMIDLMINKIKNKDLAICASSNITENSIVQNSLKKIEKLLPKNINGINYFKLVVANTDLFSASACNKMYRLKKIRENNLKFPVGKLHEDLLFVFKYLVLSNNVGVVSNCLYNYYNRREGSITNRINENDIDDVIFTYKELSDFLIKNNYIDLEESVEFKEYMFLWISRATLFKLAHLQKNYIKEDINKTINKIKNNVEYKKLCDFILLNSTKFINKMFVRFLYLNNSLFLYMLKANQLRNKLKKTVKMFIKGLKNENKKK